MLRLLTLCALVIGMQGKPVNINWPEFRGPSANGHSQNTGLPTAWSETQNVRWKTPIHGKGWSTPVVWGNQIWFTTATDNGSDMFVVCVDRNSGKILLDQKLFTNTVIEPLGNDVNCYASPSCVIEKGRVWVHFGSYGSACLDTKSFKIIWQRRDLKCRHYRGPSSSPIIFENLLIVTMDGADLQYTIALDKFTGETKWRTERTSNWNDLDASGKPAMEGDMRKAHSTPIVIFVNSSPLLISSGAKAAFAYDPRTGREIWKMDHRGMSASMRPVAGKELAYVTTGYGGADFCAVKLSSLGTVSPTQVAWKSKKMIPSKPSPLLVGDLIFLLNDSGVMTCLDANTGEQIWQERIGGRYSASPLLAEGHIYCFGEDGRSLVLNASRKYELVSESSLADGMMASPAVSGTSLILRTKTHLYRIEAGK